MDNGHGHYRCCLSFSCEYNCLKNACLNVMIHRSSATGNFKMVFKLKYIVVAQLVHFIMSCICKYNLFTSHKAILRIIDKVNSMTKCFSLTVNI